MAWNPNTNGWGYFCEMDPIVSDERDERDGAFKISSLRNLELIGSYFHNGGRQLWNRWFIFIIAAVIEKIHF